MRLTCPHCRHAVEFGAQRPRFCSHCGQALGGSVPVETQTVERPESAGSSQDQTREFRPGVDTDSRSPVPRRSGRAPEQIGGYRLLRRLGGGGMGSVYEAEHISSGQRAAVKLINAEALSPQAVERFRLEGRLASSILHPRCVFVLAADEEAGQPYIVMELMPGTTLADLVAERGPLSPKDAVTRILDVIDGLREAHRLGVIHRDVKPSNCFLDADGRVKVGDFGLAKSQADEDSNLTRTGGFVGTVLFAAPEQLRRQPVDIQADVYSVSATLYFLLTGKPPFDDVDPLAATARIVTENPPLMRELRPELPEALDRVVLRGLERDKVKRWGDLDALRAALLPLLPGKLSAAGLGFRLAAVVIDFIVIFVLVAVAQLLFSRAGMLSAGPPLPGPHLVPYILRSLGISFAAWLLFFAVPEIVWGFSLGKWCFRLRVCAANGIDRPGVVNGLLRTVLFFAMWHLDTFIEVPVFALLPVIRITDTQLALLAAGLSLGGKVLMVVLPLATMRKSNGYRGPHEFLSQTRVVQLPDLAGRPTLAGVSFQPPSCEPTGLPQRVGPFTIREAWRWEDNEKSLVGEDPSLGRTVLIWLRSGADAPLEAKRRDIGRPTRMRWVASGVDVAGQWDAFLAPTGAPLPEVVAQLGRLSWDEARPILDELAAELSASCREGTLPKRLTPHQVWVNARGRVQLVGGAIYDVAIDQATTEDAPAECGRALVLLADAAALLLEGHPRPAGQIGPIRAPLPQPAARCLNRLRGVGIPYASAGEFRKALRGLPSALSRPQRLAHLCVQALLLAVVVAPTVGIWVFSPLYSQLIRRLILEEEMRQLQNVQLVDTAIGSMQPDVGTRIIALARAGTDEDLRQRALQHIDQDRRLTDERLRWHNGFVQWSMRQNLPMQEKQFAAALSYPPAYDTDIRRQLQADIEGRHQAESGTFRFVAALTTGIVLAWAVWAFLTRGGLSLRFSGIKLVRGDGRPAARWQCLVRALLVWLPVLACVVGSAWLDMRYWSSWPNESARHGVWMPVTAWVLSWLAPGLLLAFFARAMWKPERSWHDRLTGTWLVPR
ncbi:MAG: protein kinase domain-containing protein [Gemmataceae bacterium]